MTGSIPMDPNPLRATSSPLAFGAASYAAVMRSQLEMTMHLTAAWAATVSAMSSGMLAQVPSDDSDGSQAPRDAWSNGFRGLRAVGDLLADGNRATEERSTGSTWRPPVFDQPKSGMLRWLTEPPTLQTNLFDETIELLVDEDIKTAS